MTIFLNSDEVNVMMIEMNGSATVTATGWVHADICPVCGCCGFIDQNAGDYCPSCGAEDADNLTRLETTT